MRDKETEDRLGWGWGGGVKEGWSGLAEDGSCKLISSGPAPGLIIQLLMGTALRRLRLQIVSLIPVPTIIVELL